MCHINNIITCVELFILYRCLSRVAPSTRLKWLIVIRNGWLVGKKPVKNNTPLISPSLKIKLDQNESQIKICILCAQQKNIYIYTYKQTARIFFRFYVITYYILYKIDFKIIGLLPI